MTDLEKDEATLRLSRPTLSVLVAVHEHGALAAEALKHLRPIADEIIVAFDGRMPSAELGPLEKIADNLVGFEFSGPIRFRGWLREQARGDWLLMLDGDEVASRALVDALPDLIRRRDISGYQLPCWWTYPDGTSRLNSAPWEHDRMHLRLVRNDGNLLFPGLIHTAGVRDYPTRIIDTPFIHLDLIMTSEEARAEKVRRYDQESFPHFAANGRLINKAFYLPERNSGARTAKMPPREQELVATVMARKDDPGFEPNAQPAIVPASEIEKWWAAAPPDRVDCRAEIDVLSEVKPMWASTPEILEVDVTNTGESVWPASDFSLGRLIYLSYHWRDMDGADVIFEGKRAQLTSRVLPGERVRIWLIVNTPPKAGRFKLVIDLTLEHVRWFGVDKTVTVDVRTLASTAERVLYGFPLIALSAARDIRDGLRLSDALAGGLNVEGTNISPKSSLMADWIKDNGFRRVLKLGGGIATSDLAAALCGSRWKRRQILSVETQDEAGQEEALRRSGLERDAAVVGTDYRQIAHGDLRTPSYDLTGALADRIRAFAPDCVLVTGPAPDTGASRLSLAPELGALLSQPTPFLLDEGLTDNALEIADRWAEDPNVRIEGILAVGDGFLAGVLGPDRD